MKSFAFHTLVLLLCFLVSACEKEKSGLIDLNYGSPYLSGVTLNHSSLNLDIDSTGSVQKLDSVSFRITIQCSGVILRKASDAPSHAILQIFKPGETSPFLSSEFSVESAGEDTFSFSGPVSFIIQYTDIGALRLEFSVVTAGGVSSNLVQRSLIVGRKIDRVPQILDESVPDTVVLPPGDSLLIKMTATVGDSDGLADIKEVFFYSLNSSNPLQKFKLYDDGSMSTNPPSGDQVAGDGIYTITVKLVDDPVHQVRKTYRFEFHAVDKQGASAAPVVRQLTVI